MMVWWWHHGNLPEKTMTNRVPLIGRSQYLMENIGIQLVTGRIQPADFWVQEWHTPACAYFTGTTQEFGLWWVYITWLTSRTKTGDMNPPTFWECTDQDGKCYIYIYMSICHRHPYICACKVNALRLDGTTTRWRIVENNSRASSDEVSWGAHRSNGRSDAPSECL